MGTIENPDASALRRTLAAVSWLYALSTALLGGAAWGRPRETVVDARLLLLHAGLFAVSAVLLWKPRRGATVATIAAAAGSILFVVLDLARDSIEAALMDGAYVVLAAVLLYKSRRQA